MTSTPQSIPGVFVPLAVVPQVRYGRSAAGHSLAEDLRTGDYGLPDVGLIKPGADGVERMLVTSLSESRLVPDRLVLSELSDRHSQWVHGNYRVGYVVLHREHEPAIVRFAADLPMIGRRVVHLLEIDGRPIRRLPKTVDRHALSARVDANPTTILDGEPPNDAHA